MGKLLENPNQRHYNVIAEVYSVEQSKPYDDGYTDYDAKGQNFYQDKLNELAEQESEKFDLIEKEQNIEPFEGTLTIVENSTLLFIPVLAYQMGDTVKCKIVEKTGKYDKGLIVYANRTDLVKRINNPDEMLEKLVKRCLFLWT